MAELFGAVTAAVGLIGVIDALIGIGGRLVDVATHFRDAGSEHGRLVNEVHSLRVLLPTLKTKLESARESEDANYRSLMDAFLAPEGDLVQCGRSIDRIVQELEKFLAGSTTRTAEHRAQSLPSHSAATESRLPLKRTLSQKTKGIAWSFVNQALSKSTRTTTVTSPLESPPAMNVTGNKPSRFQKVAWPSTLNTIGNDLARIDRFKITVHLVLALGVTEYVFPTSLGLQPESTPQRTSHKAQSRVQAATRAF